jgi:lipid-A-disaccharide synthase
VGIGGDRMKDAGVELLSGISSSLGLTETLRSLKKVRDSYKRAAKALTEVSPDVVVLIDYPDFNFRVAKAAKRRGIKVLYYVSPQVWAWRKGRVKTMGEITDRIAVVLPFEEEIYRGAGIPCEFVGHPIMEEVEEYESAKPEVQGSRFKVQSSGTKTAGPMIALLPGSRPNELRSLLPLFAAVVTDAKKEFEGCRFILPLAPNIETEKFRTSLDVLEKEGVEFAKKGATPALASSDMAIIASGTATLQAALLGIPMVVVYKVSPLTYFFAKRILAVKYISLVNVIEGKEVVPELIQHEASRENIMNECRKILYDGTCKTSMVSAFRSIRELFSGKRPSRRVAEMIGEMAGWKP